MRRESDGVPKMQLALAPLALGALLLLLSPPAGSAPRPAAGAAVQAPQTAETVVLQGAVRFHAVRGFWKVEVEKDDPSAVSLVNKDAGLQIVLRWVANKARMESRRAAAVLESKLMRADNSAGRQFSFPRRHMVGGREGSAFTVDTLVDRAGVHRTQYLVVSSGSSCLVVAVSGGVDLLEKHKRQVDGVLDSISFI